MARPNYDIVSDLFDHIGREAAERYLARFPGYSLLVTEEEGAAEENVERGASSSNVNAATTTARLLHPPPETLPRLAPTWLPPGTHTVRQPTATQHHPLRLRRPMQKCSSDRAARCRAPRLPRSTASGTSTPTPTTASKPSTEEQREDAVPPLK
ncbi:hypothetical protein ILUMI_13072 [Ignelater luminosus]|uniref:Uncharacterized protein n=1 Tax=Ignelater luminosus TaxID=2038154 RepID=A0A8K0GB77_IGNLU|nr:hypothetical protein ILUMI_13072 [Ignelater luminosus]